MTKPLIIRADMAQGGDDKLDLSNLLSNLKKQFHGYPENTIVLLSPFHTPQSDVKPFEKMDKITGIWKGNLVQGSIYASDKLFTTTKNEEVKLDFCEFLNGSEEKLKEICNTLKSQNSVLMYDLVLNHLGSHSTQMKELEEKFAKEHPGIELASIHKPFDDVKSFNYENQIVRNFVFENLHKPLIDKLVNLGFGGFRIDAAGHVHIDYQRKISEYLGEKFKDKPCEILLEYMHSFGGISQDDCLKCWGKENINIGFTSSSFLGLKLSEREKEMKDGYPKWVIDTMYSVGLNKISGMIGNHDEYNLHSKVASLIAQQSIMHSGYPKEGKVYEGKEYDIKHRQFFNGNKGGFGGPELSDTSGILTIENQLKILNGEIKNGNFAGFGEIDKEKLIKIYKAKCIEIAHSEIESNAQVMIGIGPMGDLNGKIGANSVFSKPDDFTNGKKRILEVLGTYRELDVSNQVINMISSKKTTLSPGQWIEKTIVFEKENPEYNFTSVIIKHLDNKYYDGEKIEISYASSDGNSLNSENLKKLKNHVIDILREKHQNISENIINNSDIYNATKVNQNLNSFNSGESLNFNHTPVLD
jgi:hypothetical protein